MQQTLHFDALHTALKPIEWECRVLHITISLFEQGFSVHLQQPTDQGTTVIIQKLSSLQIQKMIQIIQNLIEKINLEYGLQYPAYEEKYVRHLYCMPFGLTEHIQKENNQLEVHTSRKKQLLNR
ncbi:TPA: hypothetical protein QCS32_006122 [Bacillus thuringiensis]|nr:hypothetical protein [Bacillus cereus]HDR5354305.1 hypothetical protein [Bacillus thuringiensis]